MNSIINTVAVLSLTALCACASIPRSFSAAEEATALQAMMSDYDRACLAPFPNQRRAEASIRAMTAESPTRSDAPHRISAIGTARFGDLVHDHNVLIWAPDEARFGPCQLDAYNVSPERLAAAILATADARGFRFSSVQATRHRVENWGPEGYRLEWRIARGNGTAVLSLMHLPALLNTSTILRLSFE